MTIKTESGLRAQAIKKARVFLAFLIYLLQMLQGSHWSFEHCIKFRIIYTIATYIHMFTLSPLQRLSAVSYRGFFLLWAMVVLFFAIIYVLLSYIPGENGLTSFDGLLLIERFWQALYFSIINATNTGYGDIVPLGVARFFATIEAVLGLFLFALFTAKLLLVKQERLSSAIYRDMRETTLRNMREDLYIVRKDLKKLIRFLTNESGIINERGWERLNIAYRQLVRVIRDIELFYDEDIELDSLDEAMILHALYRTLGRVASFNDALIRNRIESDNYTSSTKNLVIMIQLLGDFLENHADEVQERNKYLVKGLSGLHVELQKNVPVENLQKEEKSLE